MLRPSGGRAFLKIIHHYCDRKRVHARRKVHTIPAAHSKVLPVLTQVRPFLLEVRGSFALLSDYGSSSSRAMRSPQGDLRASFPQATAALKSDAPFQSRRHVAYGKKTVYIFNVSYSLHGFRETR